MNKEEIEECEHVFPAEAGYDKNDPLKKIYYRPILICEKCGKDFNLGSTVRFKISEELKKEFCYEN